MFDVIEPWSHHSVYFLLDYIVINEEMLKDGFLEGWTDKNG